MICIRAKVSSAGRAAAFQAGSAAVHAVGAVGAVGARTTGTTSGGPSDAPSLINAASATPTSRAAEGSRSCRPASQS